MGSSGSLKRVHEEIHGSPMASSSRRRVEPALPPEVKAPTDEEARYIAAAEREFVMFAGKPEKYEEFDAVLGEFRRGRLGVASVVERMELVLQGHPYLIRGFNKFLPSGYFVRDLYYY